jgi:hypothetical protein
MRAGWGGYSLGEGIRLGNYCVCAKAFITYVYIRATLAGATLLQADVFGTAILQRHPVP